MKDNFITTPELGTMAESLLVRAVADSARLDKLERLLVERCVVRLMHIGGGPFEYTIDGSTRATGTDIRDLLDVLFREVEAELKEERQRQDREEAQLMTAQEEEKREG